MLLSGLDETLKQINQMSQLSGVVISVRMTIILMGISIAKPSGVPNGHLLCIRGTVFTTGQATRGGLNHALLDKACSCFLLDSHSRFLDQACLA